MTQTAVTLITTGGTIGSSIEENSVSVSRGQQALRTHIVKICAEQGWALDIIPAFNKNSEDLAAADWLQLIREIERKVRSGCDSIVITHGTDTMAYTATALALCCAGFPARIVLTGSCYSLDHPKSDVTSNLLGGLRACAEHDISPGVYVSFSTPSGEVRVISALDIKPMAFDEQTFDGCYQQRIGRFKGARYYPTPERVSPICHSIAGALDPANIDETALKKTSSQVFQLVCYPGMDTQQLCAALLSGSIVIVQLYHSGTGPSTTDAGLIETIKQRTDLTFLLASLPASYIGKPYASSLALIESGAHLYQDLQPHQLFVVLTLGLASGLSKEKILDLIKPFEVSHTVPISRRGNLPG